jgi:uncharacterized repeat protein (TIGR03803 family)
LAGGANGDGTVFEIANNNGNYASTPTTLANFYCTGLYADAAGNLIGTTSGGGAYNNGTVFEIAKTGGSYASTPTTLINFDGNNGSGPNGNLIADAAGDLFGTTELGANGLGTVFEVAKISGSYASTPTTLASFNGATNGSSPLAGLIADAAGDLFGTTYGGGANGVGTVFEIAKTSTGYASAPTTLASFNATNGSSPAANLITDAAGDLFGTTQDGGANGGHGTVFEINRLASGGPSGGKLTVRGNQLLELFGPSNASVNFASGSTGTFKLDSQSTFGGTVAGLAPSNHLDLAGLAYQGDSTPAYAPNGANTAGILTVTEGAQAVSIALLGGYMAASFVVSSDGHGGTLVTDPSLPGPTPGFSLPSHHQ